MTHEFFQGVNDQLTGLIEELESGLDPQHDLHGDAQSALFSLRSAQTAIAKCITATVPQAPAAPAEGEEPGETPAEEAAEPEDV